MIQRQDYYFYWSSPQEKLPLWLSPYAFVSLGEMWVTGAFSGDAVRLTHPRWVHWRRGDDFVRLISVAEIENILNGESNERLAKAYE